MDSILHQRLTPKLIVIIDDGSTDGTTGILSDYKNSRPDLIKLLNLQNHGYDIRRVPRNINMVLSCVSMAETQYFMISGDDCVYPADYASTLVERMEREDRLVIASGSIRGDTRLIGENYPAGSGRMIRSSFMEKVGGGFPVKAGWEAWLLYKAMVEGCRVRAFSDVVLEHVRPRGAEHQLVYWGAAMHTLGYHPLYALGRIVKNLVTRQVPVKATLKMIVGYLVAFTDSKDAFLMPYDTSLRAFVRKHQASLITHVVRSSVLRFMGMVRGD